MEPKLTDLVLEEFLGTLASAAPAPGGGSVAALNLALSAALIEMVTALTIGRKRYYEVEEAMLRLRERGAALRYRALELISEDAAAYQAVVAAYALPREDEAERLARSAAIQSSTRIAIEVPLETAKLAIDLLHLAIEAMAKGNRNATSDALIAGYQATIGCYGALANVRINLPTLADENEAAAYEAECCTIATAAEKLAEEADLWRKATLG